MAGLSSNYYDIMITIYLSFKGVAEAKLKY